MSADPSPERPAPSPALPTAEPGAPSIPGYELLLTLGIGGAGTVYEARATDGLGRRFAIKVFPPARRREYERELETLRGIEAARAAESSQDLVETIGAGETEAGLAHVIMAYAAGVDLRARVAERGPLPPAEAVAAMIPVLRGLRLLHARGLVHKDVKPANVLLDEGDRARLGDFGLTRVLDGAPLSSAGTPGFCAPELITGRQDQAGVQVDIYSAAATLYFLLTGAAPLPGRPDLFLLERRLVDRPLQDLLFRALALEPAARPASAEAFLQELTAWQRGELRAPRAPLGWGWRLLAWALVLGLLGSVPLADVARSRWGPSPADEAPADEASHPLASPDPRVEGHPSGDTGGPPGDASPPPGTVSPAPGSASPVPSTPSPAPSGREARSKPGPLPAGREGEAGALAPSPSWDGAELAWGDLRWREGTALLPGGEARTLFPVAPAARARAAEGGFAAALADGAVVVFDAWGEPVLKLPGVPGEVFPSLALDATHLLRVWAFFEAEGRDRVTLYDLEGRALADWEGAPVATCAALLPSAAGLPGVALGTPDGRLLILDLAAQRVALELQTHDDEVLALAYDPRRDWLLVLGDARGDQDLEPRLELKAYPLDDLTQAVRPRVVLPLAPGAQPRLPD